MIAFLIAIVAMLLMIAKWKIHPFLSIMLMALILAIIAGIPITQVPKVIGEGFSATFTSIGLVIIFGALIGSIIERTGAALTLADTVIRIIGRHRPALAIELMGWVVSIPVFCDSGFVILNPIREALAKRTGASAVMLTVCLSCGLYVSHVFIPPTPGPIAAAEALGIGENLLLVIALGAVVSIFPLTAGYFYARYISSRVTTGNNENTEAPDQTAEAYTRLRDTQPDRPGAIASLAPIIIPIVLMSLSSIASMLHLQGMPADICVFIGHPLMALAVGVLAAICLLIRTRKTGELFTITDNTLRTVGPILFITAAGSVLGRVIAASDLMQYITQKAPLLNNLGLLFPFLVAAVFKTAQGSSTVAITTTASLIAPLLPSLGLTTPSQAALAVLAIGAGATTVSHANDSYFWVVTRLGNLSVEQGYKTHTTCTLIIGVTSIIAIIIISQFV